MTTDQHKILYLSPMMDYGKDSSSVLRVLNVCMALKSCSSFDISILGRSPECDEYEIKGVKVHNLRHTKSFLSKLIFILTYPLMMLFSIKRIAPTVVITYCVFGFPLFILQLYCKLNKIKIVGDIVEWFEYSFLNNKLQIPAIHWTMTSLNKRMDGIIAISSFLEEYYKPHVPTIFIPPVFDNNYYLERQFSETNPYDESYLNLVYAGISGKKDLLNNVIKGVDILVENGKQVRLYIIGASQAEIETMYNLHLNNSSIFCYKYMPHEGLLPYVVNADYTVIIRHEHLRYAKAGFSSKFVECFCCGLPVIANLSGDMGDYLKDGYNGYILPDHSVDSFVAVINRIIDSAPKCRPEMRIEANRTFVEHFHTSVYSNSLTEFIKSVAGVTSSQSLKK